MKRQNFSSGDIRPAATMVEVSRFIAPEMLVEIEADAVVVSRAWSVSQGCDAL